MKVLESYDDFMHQMFHNAHAAVTRDMYKPMAWVATDTAKEAFTEAGIDISHMYHNPKGFMDKFVYWNGPNYIAFPSINNELLASFSGMIRQRDEQFRKMMEKGEWERIFMLMEKKILITCFKEYFDQIPDNQKYAIFSDLYVRSEFGFELFDDQLLKRVFAVKDLDPEHQTRMHAFMADAKKNTKEDGSIVIYHGQQGNYDPKDEMSWTLSQKTAKFFANRFAANGKVVSKRVRPEEVADYFDSRGEKEVIVLPPRLR